MNRNDGRSKAREKEGIQYLEGDAKRGLCICEKRKCVNIDDGVIGRGLVVLWRGKAGGLGRHARGSRIALVLRDKSILIARGLTYNVQRTRRRYCIM